LVGRIFEFGDFRLDCDRFELYRAGRSLKLELKPMELLILLAGRTGQLVTRAEIAESLWDREVFVDTEHGINTAIRKIRQVLGDDPEQPRFLLTVTGKGYRFIGAAAEGFAPLAEGQSEPPLVENGGAALDYAIEQPASPPIQNPPAPAQQAELRLPVKSTVSNNPRLIWLGALAAAAVLAFFISVTLSPRSWNDRFLARAAKPDIKSLAVLPLDNLSGDPGQEYFADGMTDELTTMLAKDSTLRIVSRTSVMQYKGAHRPLPEIARELGVDGVLEGSIARSGDKVHMTIQLIQALSDTHVWAESYDRNANELVSLSTEATQTIARKLNSAVLPPAPTRFVNAEAHDAYLHGNYLWYRGKNEEAGAYFRKATELQPDYALAWTGLAGYYGVGSEYATNPEASLAKSEAAAAKAVELDDSLPEAHQTLGAAIFAYRWDWDRSQQEVTRAIQLDPKFSQAYHFRANILAALNRNQEAIEAQKKATELDPFARPWALPRVYVWARQYDAALAATLEQLEANPRDPEFHELLARIYRCKGLYSQAALEWEKQLSLSGDEESAANVRRAFQRNGYKGAMEWQLSQLKKKSATQYVAPFDFAYCYAQLGEREQTLASLEGAYRQHAVDLLWLQSEPAFDFVHSDERYRSIIRGIGLPPAY
jgi:TolB-like protein/DNA-binding winged helix-turn-helix (wHTH) protein